MALLMSLTTWLTGANILLLLAILSVYYKNMLKMKSSFTAGLFLFASLFLLQNLVSFYFFFTMMPYFVDAVELHVFILTALQTTAFIILNWITWR